jgi:hypothetical protein
MKKTLLEIGLGAMAAGGLSIAIGAWLVVRAERHGTSGGRGRERILYLAGGLLLTLGAGLQLIAAFAR